MRIADTWFQRRRMDDGITWITEPHVHPFIRCNVWHVPGRDRDLLVDTALEHFPTLWGHLTGFFCPVVRSASKCDVGHRMRSATRPRDKRTRPSVGRRGSSAAFRRLPAIWDSGAPHRAARRACPPHCPNEPLRPIK